MRREIVFAPQAAEDEKRLRANERATVRDKIKRHLRHDATKTSRSRIKRLRELKQPQYRLRVDDIRVFYDVTEETVEILAIVLKSEAAAWLERYGKPAPEDELAEQRQPDKEGEKS
jgi:mRNA-degrading endonuclease RelE of RelBE toxin-antitoxin system